MKIGLFVMSERGWAVLKDLAQHHRECIQFVVSSRNREVEADCYDEIKASCEENGLEFFDREDEFEIGDILCIAVGWRWLIRDLEEDRLIVAHDSLLPKYRGFAPVVSMLINGETSLGVTLIFASDQYDAGDIIGRRQVEIEYPITLREAYAKLCPLYVDLVRNTVDRLQKHEPVTGAPQNEGEASYSLWRDAEDYRIDFGRSAEECRRFVDAVGYPFKGAMSRVGSRLVRVFECTEVPDVSIENRDVGKVIRVEDGCPVVVCGTGLLKLTRVVFDDAGESALPLSRFRVRFS
jgi:methionyl-tRNA formyltransferase